MYFGFASVAMFRFLVVGFCVVMVLTYGFGPIGEMLTLAALFLGSMWFMALRYTQGLKD